MTPEDHPNAWHRETPWQLAYVASWALVVPVLGWAFSNDGPLLWRLVMGGCVAAHMALLYRVAASGPRQPRH